jgi:hypothetical protein
LWLLAKRTVARILLPSLLLLGLFRPSITAQGRPASTPELEIYPSHFLLHPREQIHYQVRAREGDRSRSVQKYEFAIENSEIVRRVEAKGELFIEALRPGRTEVVVRTATSERRVTIEVAGPARPPITAVHHSALPKIAAKELLFVGHANLDGWDHTGVAKPGIDRLVQQAKESGWTVVYWVSEEYPYWYTADRNPDYAIISEGQEHQIRVDADRVVFSGGDFMYCVLRNVQMTLHGMIRADTRDQLHFVFPPEAIWTGQGAPKPYPAPMGLLSSLLAESDSDLERYEAVVVPFLDRLFTEYPVLNYPPDAPSPELGVLVAGWNVEVVVGDTFKRTYRRGDSSRTIVMEFRTL